MSLLASIPKGKEKEVLAVLEKWAAGDLTIDQADQELKELGVIIPEGGYNAD